MAKEILLFDHADLALWVFIFFVAPLLAIWIQSKPKCTAKFLASMLLASAFWGAILLCYIASNTYEWAAWLVENYINYVFILFFALCLLAKFVQVLLNFKK